MNSLPRANEGGAIARDAAGLKLQQYVEEPGERSPIHEVPEVDRSAGDDLR